MRVIGICGYPRVGKDTLADLFVKDGYTKVELKAPLWEIILAVNPWVKVFDKVHGIDHMAVLQELNAKYSYTWIKANTDVRPQMQNLGSVLETFYGEDHLCTIAENKIVDGGLTRVVIPDVRTRAQFEFIDYYGGQVIRVDNPRVGRYNEHPSDTHFLTEEIDYIIRNDRTLDDLRDSYRELFGRDARLGV